MDVNKMTIAETMSELKTYDKYKNLTEYKIKREIGQCKGGNKMALLVDLREEIKKLRELQNNFTDSTKESSNIFEINFINLTEFYNFIRSIYIEHSVCKIYVGGDKMIHFCAGRRVFGCNNLTSFFETKKQHISFTFPLSELECDLYYRKNDSTNIKFFMKESDTTIVHCLFSNGKSNSHMVENIYIK